MSKPEEVKLSIKVMINREKNQVLFAEVGSYFADILLSFLTLPLARVLRLINSNHGDDASAFGSLTTLYDSLANLEAVHFWTEEGKNMLLNPRNLLGDFCRKLKLNLDNTPPFKFYSCGSECPTGSCDLRHMLLCMYEGLGICKCGDPMTRVMDVRDYRWFYNMDGDEVFTRKSASFLITDDLQMAPTTSLCFMNTIRSLGITEAEGIEQRTELLGLNEMIDLLKWSILSRTPLTYVILKKGPLLNESSTEVKQEAVTLLQPQIHCQEEKTSDSNKMIVKAMLQKSTNKLLFLQSKDDFVDFLFSLLTIPLGSAARLLNNARDVIGICNLYKSVANFSNNVHLKTQKIKSAMLELELPPMYLSNKQILPLKERECPKIYYYTSKNFGLTYLTGNEGQKRKTLVPFVDPKGGRSYVRSPGVFMVTDDLTVLPWSMASSIVLLNKMKVPVQDVKEVEVEIGLEEGLRILGASLLSSKAALTYALESAIKGAEQPQEEE